MGVRGAMVAAGVSTAACGLGIALAAHSAVVLIALLMIGGIGNALAGPGASAILRVNIATNRHGLAFGAQQAGAPMGSLLAGVALPLVAIPFGWRWVYVALAVLAIGSALAVPPIPGHAAGRTSRIPRAHAKPIWVLAFAATCASAAAVGVVGFTVTFAVHSGISQSGAGWLLASLSLVAVICRVALGNANDRRQSSSLRFVVPMLILACIGYLLLIPGRPVPVVVGSLIAGALGWSWPGPLTHAVVRLSPDEAASAVGVMMSGLFLGAVLGPLLVGLFAHGHGFTIAWILCAILALAAAAAVKLAQRLSHDAL
jgi:MFS family permease